ncbi:MAG TPA: DUF3048 domain-containing protein [Roseiflexaceae bacterium]|nr:DUF3048 domain-containing protein [Roseiflexaceae bacterium]
MPSKPLLALLLLAALAPGALPARAAPAQAATIERGTLMRRPFVVMIDNHPKAYPQSGLDKAALVFEALAEFGITRFMAVYVPGVSPDAPAIGPVRSARIYFVQWAMGLHGLYAHAGGSPTGLRLAESTDQIVNLDALHRGGGSYFARNRRRPAPHNLYTSSASLQQAADRLGVAELVDPEAGFLIKPDAPPEQRPAAQSLSYYFLARQERAGWTYDPASNSYLRLRRGKPAVDGATGQQLSARNVVVIEVQQRPIPGDPKQRIEQEVVGSGPGVLFQDGTARDITWVKEAAGSPLRFYHADGSEAQMNQGQVWVAAVPALANLSVR